MMLRRSAADMVRADRARDPIRARAFCSLRVVRATVTNRIR
jgi:hypothetical protein